jgi:hypothetical protein
MLLTIPYAIKGASTTITLSKSDLFALALVQADSYFSNAAHVRRAFFVYESSPGNQKEILKFDLSQSTPATSLLVSEHARDVFLLAKIILEDFDGGSLVINRSDLPTGNDITPLAQTYTGSYNNGRTYAPGESVTFNGNRYVLVYFIGAAGYAPIAYTSWVDLGPEA